MNRLFLTLIPVLVIIGFTSCKSEEPQQEAEGKVIHIASGCDEGDEEEPLPMINGTVSDNMFTPIQGACVNLTTATGTFISVTGSGATGHYFFNLVSDGNYKLITIADGYENDTIPFMISDGEPVILNPTLE